MYRLIVYIIMKCKNKWIWNMFYFHLLPLDKWDLCKTGTLNVHSWAIKVIVNRRFWINYIMIKKKIIIISYIELLTLPEHLSSSPFLSGVRVTRSLVLCVCFVYRCLSFCPFSFGHCVACPSDLRILITPLVSSNSSYINCFTS